MHRAPFYKIFILTPFPHRLTGMVAGLFCSGIVITCLALTPVCHMYSL
jgi:hypothetical protein